MTVSSVTNKWSYAGDGSQQAFPYGVRIYVAADLKVYVVDVNGSEELQTLDSDYTVDGVGSEDGGNVNFVTPPADGETVIVKVELPLTQELALPEAGILPTGPLEIALDRTVLLIQDLQERFERSLHLSIGNTALCQLPKPAPNNLIGWDSLGENITQYPAVPELAVVTQISQYNDSLSQAVSDIGSGTKLLMINKAITIDADLVVPNNIYPWITPEGRITAINCTLSLPSVWAGLHHIFNCVGTGKVILRPGGVKEFLPQWYGAVVDDATDCTAALVAMEAGAWDGAVVRLIAGKYKTTGWLITKTLALVSHTPFLYGSGSQAATLKAAGAQDYVVKFQGVYAADASTFLHPRIKNINIDGDDQTINDAGLVMEYCHLTDISGLSLQNCAGRGARFRCMWEMKLRDYFIHQCGVLDTGEAVLFDGVSPLDYTKGCNSILMTGGTWSANKGTWLRSSSLANIDAFIFDKNKLEPDDLTILNTVDTNVIALGSCSRSMIINNTFASFGATYGKYTNLIWIGGANDDGDSGAAGGPGNQIRGNRYYGQAGSGSINGLSLAANAPPVVEDNNESVSNASPVVTVPNANVSIYQQIINLAWKSFSTSMYPYFPMPNREPGGYLSTHRMSHGAAAQVFEADADCLNNAQTVLKLTAADQVNGTICQQIDMIRFVGSAAKNVVVRVRMKLDDIGSISVYCNGVAPGWYPALCVVDQESWTWYEFVIPTAQFTTTNHFLDIYYWQVNSGTANLLVDGVEFDTSNALIETVTTGSPALNVAGIEITYLDSSGGAITGTLADGTPGLRKRIIMTDATTESTITVTHCAAHDPGVFTFPAGIIGATLILEWDGSTWQTIGSYGVTYADG